MGDKSTIAWCDATWNPIVGCSKVDEGCRNCYAIDVSAGMEQKKIKKYFELTKKVNDRIEWTNLLRIVPEALPLPLQWKKPKKIFVNSMSDLFVMGVHDGFLGEVFSVMERSEKHTFQILTKRVDRMIHYCRLYHPKPLANVWLGASIAEQKDCDRLEMLAKVPAAVRWVSVEPQIEKITLGKYLLDLDLVVCGGESGTHARRFDIEWARALMQECRLYGVPFFMKQLGSVLAKEYHLKDRKGEDMNEWPEDLRVREFPVK